MKRLLGERIRLGAAPVNAYNQAVRLAQAGDRSAAIDALKLSPAYLEASAGLSRVRSLIEGREHPR